MGIHWFGSGAAFDLNDAYYAWNNGRDGIYVFYKADYPAPDKAGAVGSITSAGGLAGIAGASMLLGIIIGIFVMNGRRGRKDKAAAA